MIYYKYINNSITSVGVGLYTLPYTYTKTDHGTTTMNLYQPKYRA